MVACVDEKEKRKLDLQKTFRTFNASRVLKMVQLKDASVVVFGDDK